MQSASGQHGFALTLLATYFSLFGHRAYYVVQGAKSHFSLVSAKCEHTTNIYTIARASNSRSWEMQTLGTRNNLPISQCALFLFISLRAAAERYCHHSLCATIICDVLHSSTSLLFFFGILSATLHVHTTFSLHSPAAVNAWYASSCIHKKNYIRKTLQTEFDHDVSILMCMD